MTHGFHEKKLSGRESSWKPLLHIYQTTRIPWLMLIMVLLTSLGTQWVGVQIVTYTAKIDTGTMTGGLFLVGYVTYAVLSFLFEYAYDMFAAIGNAQISRNVRKGLWGKMLRMPVSFYEKEDPQRLVSRITKDTTYAYAALSGLIQIFSVVYGIVIAMIPVVRLFGSYAWIVAVIIPVLFVCSWITGKIQYRIERMINHEYARMTSFYSERLPNMTYIKTNNMERQEYEQGLRVSHEKYKADILYKALYALQLPLESLANYIGLVFVLITASAMVRAGTMSSVELKELMLYFEVVMEDSTLIIGIWMALKTAHGGTEVIADISTAEPEALDGGPLSSEQENIVFDHVTFGYTSDKIVLQDASFTIPAGKMTAIIGENGSGKSTITRLLERFDTPQSGRILVGRQSLHDIDGTSWRDRLGYVFQGDQMIEGTIRENIAYGARGNYTEEELIQAAEEAFAYDFIQEKETGFETPVHVFDSELSGGQIQRLAIARVLMKHPDYLIMDEALSSIDYAASGRILNRVREEMDGRTLMIISHDMDQVMLADHVIVLKDGQVEAEGSPEVLMKTSPTLKAWTCALKEQEEEHGNTEA